MTDRVISVRLKIEVDQARRDAQAASRALVQVADSAERAGRSGQSLGKLASAARGAGLAVAGIGTVAVGGMAALTASTLKTGIGYNTLEQTSRAALKTVLGSASAATSQMEQLREFGKTSPFPRQVWISAQQQLLAFGMSAEKIIPTFKAVQDAVAAAGGGGQQITEVVDILAKVQSTGKVTADTLNELGYRGIDAATLIGNAMGKTAAEVREDISSQAISGVQFIDMLTGAMSARFAGAAANVKATWTGAVDRVKGAFRDVSSLLATPLVDPEGGGAAVDWANSVADALRAVEARLEPLMDELERRADPVLDAFNNRLQDLATWIKNVDLDNLAQEFDGMGPAIAGAAAGLAAFGAQGLRSVPVIGDLVGGIKPLPVALVAAAAASPELRRALFDLVDAATPLIPLLGQGAQLLASVLGPALTVVAALLQPVIAIVGFLADMFGSLPGPIQAVVGALVIFKALQMTGHLTGLTAAFQRFGSEMAAQKQYAAMAGQSIGNMNAAYSVAAAGVSRATMGAKSALAGLAGFMAGPWGIAIAAGATLLAAFAGSTDQSTGKQTGLIDALEAGTGAINEQTRAFVLNKFETSGVNDIYRQLGGDANDLTNAFLGNASALERVRGKLKAAMEGASGTDKLKYRALLELINQAPKTLGSAANAARDKAKADEEGADAANASATANTSLMGAMTGTAMAAADAATQMQAMRADLQALYDTQFGLEESQDKFQSGFHKLRSMFETNGRSVSKTAGATDKYSDSLKRQAKIVADTKKQLQDLAEAQRKAEQEAREAAQAAKQRQLDELFGRQFDTQATRDQFASTLAQAKKDIADARKERVVGATSLTGVSEGALLNRDRMRNLVQQAQAVIQAEMDRGASRARVSAVTKSLTEQLAAQAKSWGLNAQEVKTYTQAISQFGGIANREVKPNLAAVRKEYAAQRREIQANSREQLESARQSAKTSSASSGAAAATKVHTAALKGNTESAIENRAWFREQVKAAQEELIQMKAQSAGKEALTRRSQQLASQLRLQGRSAGFAERDMDEYTDAIKDSAVVVRGYPPLVVRALTAGALRTIANFQRGVDRAMARIKKNYELGIRTGSEFVNSRGSTVQGGGRQFAGMATGGPVSGPGGPREDKVPAWLSNGEFVINAKDTARTRPLLEWINSGGEIALPQFAHGGPVNLKAKMTLEGGMGRSVKRIADAFRNELFGGMGFMGGITGPINIGGSGVQRWAPLVLEVLRMLGQPASLLPNVLRRMNQESGGNPRAINLWDSNAARGTPSIGLMQTIGPTFNAYAGPFRSRGIYDPLANIYAGINYAINRYGSLRYAMDKPGGYKSGGLVDKIPSKRIDMSGHADFMRGSYRRGTPYVPMDGMYELHRGERVVPAGQNRNIQVSITVHGDGTKAADFVVDSFHKAYKNGRVKVDLGRRSA